jgi:AcrR family transcriptional regulator
MSPKQQRGEETVQRLLSAALDVYAGKGFEGFTVQAVTAASGVSLGSLYHHFGSFDGLAAALYSRCMSDLLDTLIDALRAPGTAAADAGIRGMVAAYLRFVQEHPAAARFIHASSDARFLPGHAALIAEAKAPRIAAMVEWLRPHVRAGRVVDLPEPLMEMLLIGPVAETTRRWLAGVPGIDPAVAADLLPERIWQSLRGPAA